MQIDEFNLVNPEKVSRVVDGSTDASGKFVAGLGEDGDSAAILAAYDKIGGLITGKQGATVKTGSFFDFDAKAPRKKPEVVYTFRINGQVVDVADGDQMPMQVQAAVAVKTRKPRTTKK